MFGDTEVQEYRPVFLTGPQRGIEASGKGWGYERPGFQSQLNKTICGLVQLRPYAHRKSSFIDGMD